jgi:hypothetical protein
MYINIKIPFSTLAGAACLGASATFPWVGAVVYAD